MSLWDPKNPQTFCDDAAAKGIRLFDTTYLRTPAGRVLASTRHDDGSFDEVFLDANFLDGNTEFEGAYANAMAAVEAAEGSIEIIASPAAAAWLMLTGKNPYLLLNVMNCDVPNAEMLVTCGKGALHHYLRIARSATKPFEL